jgi:hypothetical protein
MKVFLFLTAINTYICALKVFTDSRVSLWSYCSAASTSYVDLSSFCIDLLFKCI